MNFIWIPILLTVICGYRLLKILFHKPEPSGIHVITNAIEMVIDALVCLFKLVVTLCVILVIWMIYFAILALTNS